MANHCEKCNSLESRSNPLYHESFLVAGVVVNRLCGQCLEELKEIRGQYETKRNRLVDKLLVEHTKRVKAWYDKH